MTFGASDKPLPGEELDKFGLAQFPMVMGGIVPVINIEGVKPGEIVIDGPTLAKIFMGEITKWDDRGDQEVEPREPSFLHRRLPWCTAPTDRARPSTLRTICLT